MDELIEENKMLKEKVIELEERLQKYTNSSGHKKYYEKNKEKIIEDANKKLVKLKNENPDKLKEYRRRAYLKRKEKLQKEKDENI